MLPILIKKKKKNMLPTPGKPFAKLPSSQTKTFAYLLSHHEHIR